MMVMCDSGHLQAQKGGVEHDIIGIEAYINVHV